MIRLHLAASARLGVEGSPVCRGSNVERPVSRATDLTATSDEGRESMVAPNFAHTDFDAGLSPLVSFPPDPCSSAFLCGHLPLIRTVRYGIQFDEIRPVLAARNRSKPGRCEYGNRDILSNHLSAHDRDKLDPIAFRLPATPSPIGQRLPQAFPRSTFPSRAQTDSLERLRARDLIWLRAAATVG